MQSFRIQLHINYFDIRLNGYYRVFASSNENSYGLTGGRWFDGKVEKPLKLSKTSDYDLQIAEVTDYVNIESKCSRESYYECLARRFLETDFHEYFATSKQNNELRCNLLKKCSPFTLPPIGNTNIPICKNDIDRACFDEVIQNLKSDQDKHCTRSCLVKEFKLEEVKIRSQTSSNNFSFSYYFELPSSLRGLQPEKPFKTVNREYWIMTGMSLIGNVGGTLGMFIGFCFIATFEWLAEKMNRLFSCFKSQESIAQMLFQ